jgi:hypothetical protein
VERRAGSVEAVVNHDHELDGSRWQCRHVQEEVRETAVMAASVTSVDERVAAGVRSVDFETQRLAVIEMEDVL